MLPPDLLHLLHPCCAVLRTGELSTNTLSPGEGPLPEYGTLVGPGVNAQHHQHMFCARLDMAVDDEDGGKEVLVTEVGRELCCAVLRAVCSMQQLPAGGQEGRRVVAWCTHQTPRN